MLRFRVGVIHGRFSLLSFCLKWDLSHYYDGLFRVNNLRVIIARLGMLCDKFDTMRKIKSKIRSTCVKGLSRTNIFIIVLIC